MVLPLFSKRNIHIWGKQVHWENASKMKLKQQRSRKLSTNEKVEKKKRQHLLIHEAAIWGEFLSCLPFFTATKDAGWKSKPQSLSLQNASSAYEALLGILHARGGFPRWGTSCWRGEICLWSSSVLILGGCRLCSQAVPEGTKQPSLYNLLCKSLFLLICRLLYPSDSLCS